MYPDPNRHRAFVGQSRDTIASRVINYEGEGHPWWFLVGPRHGFFAGWIETGDDVIATLRWTGRDMKRGVRDIVSDMVKQAQT